MIIADLKDIEGRTYPARRRTQNQVRRNAGILRLRLSRAHRNRHCKQECQSKPAHDEDSPTAVVQYSDRGAHHHLSAHHLSRHW